MVATELRDNMSFDLRISQGDLAIGSDADFDRVEDTDKLIQDVLKILLTPLGGNPFHTWYGSLISNTLVGNVFEEEFLIKIASSQINSALETMQNLQKAQTAVQKVTPNELLAAIRDVEVNRNPVDPRIYSVFVTVLTKGLSTVRTSFSVNNL